MTCRECGEDHGSVDLDDALRTMLQEASDGEVMHVVRSAVVIDTMLANGHRHTVVLASPGSEPYETYGLLEQAASRLVEQME